MTLEAGEFLVSWRGEAKEVQLPDELYLRELSDLDLQSPKEILHFAEKYGCLGGGGQVGPDWEDILGKPLGNEQLAKINEDVQQLRLHFKKSHLEKMPRKKQSLIGSVAHVKEFTLRATLLRDLVRLWRLYKEDISFDSLRDNWENPVMPFSGIEAGVEDYAKNDISKALAQGIHAVLALAIYLEQPLSAFHVRLEIPAIIETEHFNQYEDILKRPVANLYQVLCLQLLNHINEQAVYKQCTNETCKRLFVRQRGLAQHGQYKTTGVLYCSNFCAKAQAQRTLRRRQAKARRLHREGMNPRAIAKQLGAELETVKGWIGG
ncbi:MAG: hypothetical protein IBX61_09495 [Thermoleophilia bacterium]|nr:hypothetical protein [Thermoleophilia bacterium]